MPTLDHWGYKKYYNKQWTENKILNVLGLHLSYYIFYVKTCSFIDSPDLVENFMLLTSTENITSLFRIPRSLDKRDDN